MELSPKPYPHGKGVRELASERMQRNLNLAGQGWGFGWIAFGWLGEDSFRVALGRAVSKGPVALKNVKGSASVLREENVPDGNLGSCSRFLQHLLSSSCPQTSETSS